MAPKQILILDDDANALEGFVEGLKRVGHVVVGFRHFEEAREQLRRFTPDVLITDVRVEDYNGLYLALLFRQATPNGRVIVITGYPDPVIEREAAQIGATFLLKPVGLSELERHL